MKKIILLFALFAITITANAQVAPKLFDVEFKDCKVYIKQTNSKEMWSIKPVSGFSYNGNMTLPTYDFATGNTNRQIFFPQFNTVKFEGVTYAITTSVALADTIRNYLKFCIDSSLLDIGGVDTTYIINDSLRIYGNVKVINDSIKVYGNFPVSSDSNFIKISNLYLDSILNKACCVDTSNLALLRAIYIQDSIEYAKCDTLVMVGNATGGADSCCKDTTHTAVLSNIDNNGIVTNNVLDKILNELVILNTPYNFAEIWEASGGATHTFPDQTYHSVTITITDGGTCNIDVSGTSVKAPVGYTVTYTAKQLLSKDITVDCSGGGGTALISTLKP